MSIPGGFGQPRLGVDIVLPNIIAVQIRTAQIVLGLGVTSSSRPPQPLQSCRYVLLYAISITKHRGQIVLSSYIIQQGSLPIQACCFGSVATYTPPPKIIDEGEIKNGMDIPLPGGFLIPVLGLLGIASDALSGVVAEACKILSARVSSQRGLVGIFKSFSPCVLFLH